MPANIINNKRKAIIPYFYDREKLMRFLWVPTMKNLFFIYHTFVLLLFYLFIFKALYTCCY